MAPIGTLWGDARQRQTKVILSVAALNELEVDLPKPSWSFQDKPVEFTAKFLYGKIPAFESTDGFKLVEGAAIARYLSLIGTKVNLLGSDPKDTVVVDQWVQFAGHEIGAPSYSILSLIYGFGGPFNREIFDKGTERLVRALKHLEAHLATRASGYVALDTLTLADLVLAGTTHDAARIALGTAERAQYPYIFAHYAKVTGDARLKQYWGTDLFVDDRLTEPNPLPSFKW